MNVHTGAIVGMGSYPTYDPSFYTQPHTKAQYDAFGNQPGAPLVDRADQGGYPTGSAFKPITDRGPRGRPDHSEHDLR
jgi:Cell division protein FtsI/penicillin-binding protein 2